ncbi:MAG: PilZ domain-containing protein [Azoarcus sp.]|jgi:hypothetical protein|nr:PilZ domain-containing protein [Azoarcus sp.]
MDHASPRDRRLDRRIPLRCSAHIRSREGKEISAECTELSVSGMTLRTSYVPDEGEVVEIVVDAQNQNVERPPLVTKMRVIRCHEIAGGQYEIGGSTVNVVG